MTNEHAATSSADRAAFAAGRGVCRRQARDLFFASYFLPKPKRDAAHAIGAFCLMIRGAVSIAQPTHGHDSPDARLDLLRDRLNDIYEGHLRLPDPESRATEDHVLRAVAMTVHGFAVPRQYFDEFAQACRDDATVVRYPTWPRLQSHCNGVGGAVAAMLGCVMGLTHSDVIRHLQTLGAAMRLTSILRSIRADAAARGRIYLPLEDMARYKYAERDLLNGQMNDAFRELMRFEVQRARRLYRSGSEGLCWLAGDGSRLGAATAVVGAASHLDAIERSRYAVLGRQHSSTRLNLPERLLRLPRAMRLARRAAGEPIPASVF